MKVWVIHYDDPVRDEKGGATYKSESKALEDARELMEDQAKAHFELDWRDPRPDLMEDWEEGREWVELMQEKTPEATKQAFHAYDAMIADSYAPMRISLSESVLRNPVQDYL